MTSSALPPRADPAAANPCAFCTSAWGGHLLPLNTTRTCLPCSSSVPPGPAPGAPESNAARPARPSPAPRARDSPPVRRAPHCREKLAASLPSQAAPLLPPALSPPFPSLLLALLLLFLRDRCLILGQQLL